MSFASYSVATNDYTVDQLEGEDCAACGQTFVVGEASQPVRQPGVTLAGEWNLFAHVKCPKRGASK